MAPKAKAKRRARGAKKKVTEIKIEFPGPPPTPAQEKQIKAIMGLVELACLAISRGARISRMCASKRRR
jgi:hypothetical protein